MNQSITLQELFDLIKPIVQNDMFIFVSVLIAWWFGGNIARRMYLKARSEPIGSSLSGDAAIMKYMFPMSIVILGCEYCSRENDAVVEKFAKKKPSPNSTKGTLVEFKPEQLLVDGYYCYVDEDFDRRARQQMYTKFYQWQCPSCRKTRPATQVDVKQFHATGRGTLDRYLCSCRRAGACEMKVVEKKD